MRQRLFFMMVSGCCATFLSAHSQLENLIEAKQAIMVDATTGTIILEKNIDERIAPASLTKMMTAYLAFEALSNGSVRLDDVFKVSIKAWKAVGSRTFLEPESSVTLLDLLRGIIVQSGNDAAITLAESLYLDENLFAIAMTEQAQLLGMRQSQFKNSTGLPSTGHHSSVRDMAILARQTIENFPDYYEFYRETSFTYNNIKQRNRNELLFSYEGADGLKTGYVAASGYSLAVSAKRGKRRLIAVVSGLNDEKKRTKEGTKLLDWGFRHFANYKLFRDNQTITTIPVWWGRKDSVAVRLLEPLLITMKRSDVKKTMLQLSYHSPLVAPIKKGDIVATITITHKNGVVSNHKVVAKESVAGRATWLKPFNFVMRLMGRAS